MRGRLQQFVELVIAVVKRNKLRSKACSSLGGVGGAMVAAKEAGVLVM